MAGLQQLRRFQLLRRGRQRPRLQDQLQPALNTRGGPDGRDFYFSNEYPLVRFLEKNGYDVSYISGLDTDRSGGQLLNHKVFLSVGHDEYWSGAQRANVKAARDAGVNLQFLSGNEMYWRTRYEPSAVDGAAVSNHHLVQGNLGRTAKSTPAMDGLARGGTRDLPRKPMAAVYLKTV